MGPLRIAAAAAISGTLILAGGTPAFADDISPTVVDSGITAGLIGVQPTITSTVSDDVAVVRVEIWSGRIRLAGTPDGTWTTVTLRPYLAGLRGPMVDLTVKAFDAAGNVGTSTTSVFLDQDLPTATFSPKLGSALRGKATITLSGVSGDVTSATLIERDTKRELGRFAGTSPTLVWDTAGQADYPVIMLTDQAGNEQGFHTVYHVDNEAPVIGGLRWDRTWGSGTLQVPSGRAGGSGRFEASISDETSIRRTEFWVDGKLVSTTGQWNSGSLNRAAAVEVKAWDLAGNTASRKYSIVVDNTGPSIKSVAPANGKLIRGSKLTSTVTATDPSGLLQAQLSGAGVDRSAPFSSTIAAGKDGKRTLTWTVWDRAGNPTVVRRTVIVDNTKASLKVTKAPKNKAKVKGTVKITASASDKNGVARVELLVNGKVVAVDKKAAYKFSVNTKKYGKKIKIQLRAYDKTGNVTTTSTRTWYRK
ncbi:putative secreted protein [Actinoplanes lutulentus]|uniref:Ig-like protein group 3 n=1 Tax=Actinoplanes lutulentus TaxID=1287878 RepID=A0A327Z788_9ACTN|nr:Ig-like domain-containing protein [Actinoplanes lutulentus]MBB2945111.1 putative secreted protein [Actinoplanes lutulentus]RAK31907.1 Ig-like protein group 3 [Actinoplanes lutulentus]